MSKLFISHSSREDGFVRSLQHALGDLNQDVWIDSRQLHGDDPLWPEIRKAIDEASAYAVVISTDALQSKWVGEELRCALETQKQRGKERYPVIPLSLNGTKLGVLEEFFDDEPTYVPVTSEAGGIDAALDAILVAMRRLPHDIPPAPQPKARPLEELVPELTDSAQGQAPPSQGSPPATTGTPSSSQPTSPPPSGGAARAPGQAPPGQGSPRATTGTSSSSQPSSPPPSGSAARAPGQAPTGPGSPPATTGTSFSSQPSSPPRSGGAASAPGQAPPPPDLEFFDDDAQVEVDTLGRGALAVVVARRLHAIWKKSNQVSASSTIDGARAVVVARRLHAIWKKSNQVSASSTIDGARAVVVARRLHAIHAIWKSSNQAGTSSTIDDRSAFVMHLDAPWGGGKTTFANFIARVLNPFGYGRTPAQFLRVRYGSGAGLGAIFAADPPGPNEQAVALSESHRRPWIVIEYNAWRMEHITPPWWTFYQVIRKGCFRSILREGDQPADIAQAARPKATPVRNALRWAWLWAQELRWRLWTPKLIVPLVGFALSALIFMLLRGLSWVGLIGNVGQETFAFNIKTTPGQIMAGFGALTVIGGLASLILESLAPGVDPLAERIGLGRSDPLERFRRHFHRMMCRLRRPVLVVVDDLDRCKPAVIVDLVRGIQTILRSSRIVFLVLGDRNWLETAFEAVHVDMAKVVGGVEQSVGARFVEKAIQLSFLLPGLDPAQQNAFVTGLLRGGADRAKPAAPPVPAADLRAAARAAAKAKPVLAFDAGQLRASVLETPEGKEFLSKTTKQLRESTTTIAPADPQAAADDPQAAAKRQAAQIVNEEIAIQAAVASSVEAETARRLEPLARWLPGNPRQIKRILNGIALYHAAGLQHPTFNTAEHWFQLALWIVLMTEWPATWRLLGAYPELADILCDHDPMAKLAQTNAALLPGSRAATQRELQRILNSVELMALIAGRDLIAERDLIAGRDRKGDKLDTAAVRALLSLTPPNPKLPRLPETEPKLQSGENGVRA